MRSLLLCIIVTSGSILATPGGLAQEVISQPVKTPGQIPGDDAPNQQANQKGTGDDEKIKGDGDEVSNHKAKDNSQSASTNAIMAAIIGAVSGLFMGLVNGAFNVFIRNRDRKHDLDLERLKIETKLREFQQSQAQSKENLRRDSARALALEAWKVEISKTEPPKGLSRTKIEPHIILTNIYQDVYGAMISVERTHDI